ncbi:hypothetical protein F5050DRAFT_1897243 [Lentinula boryana]|uniref:Uncharacterized protein n=1 Tax=Lentinula boryana TaxID=40481 RepID=A0ABQ8Q3Y5_9AGAR|nr:hypothetical protein F5050DRAFT_1897243 [Lentinula boryana]
MSGAFTKTGQQRKQQECLEYQPRGISDEMEDWLNEYNGTQDPTEADWREEAVDEELHTAEHEQVENFHTNSRALPTFDNLRMMDTVDLMDGVDDDEDFGELLYPEDSEDMEYSEVAKDSPNSQPQGVSIENLCVPCHTLDCSTEHILDDIEENEDDHNINDLPSTVFLSDDIDLDSLNNGEFITPASHADSTASEIYPTELIVPDLSNFRTCAKPLSATR